ncbi:MAG: phospho-sugar mutase, partial [bacterium]|nr:phospho-sugar mutase [bacterium]
GTEESHGYLTGSFVRDKDAASAALLMCECAAEQKAQGKTVREYLDDIYREFGYFSEIQESTYREGAQGSQEIAQIMAGLRKTPPTQIGGHEVVEIIDRQTGEARHSKTDSPRTVEGDKGNVLVFTFTDSGHTRVTARPSGTEPKIKYYVSATSADHSELVLENLEQTKAGVDRLAREIIDGMLEVADGVLA